jgi:tetratricopeptide (TPR) repeat protein
MQVFMKMIRTIAAVLLFASIFSSSRVEAQSSYVQEHPDGLFFEAMDLYGKEKYAAAQLKFDEILGKPEGRSALLCQRAEYLKAMCAVELFNEDAQYLLYNYVNHNPDAPNINEARFEMGKVAYRDKQYANAVKWLGTVDPLELPATARNEYYFKLGYSHFRRKAYGEARVAFYEILESGDRYEAPANYYYAHIHYEQENYQTALNHFLRLRDDETFAPIIPYYVTQIYYLQKKWDEIIAYAPMLLDSVTEKRYAEMARIIGEAYFHKDVFEEAVYYLQQYHERVSLTQPEDKYQMGYAYYMIGDHQQAMEYFKSIPARKDELSQSAMYHLGDCYVKLGEKQQARLAFDAASRMDYDKDIQEDALFNYAVLTYELSISPFNEAIRGLTRYISLYPASDRTDEAYNYLVLAFMSTKNYKAALGALEKIRRKTPEIERSYQRVAFFRGLELFRDLSFMDAINKFDASLAYGSYDPSLKSLCYYWKGESYYRLKNYDEALVQYQNFMQADGATELNEYAICHYNIGYAEFKRQHYREALNWFKRFESLNGGDNRQIMGDAYNRIGDMYFIDARYAQAIEYYDKAIRIGTTDVDYALYQKGLSCGVLNRHSDKIRILGEILEQYKGSNYTADALYETGRSYFIMAQADKAIPYYQRLLKEYPNSSYVPKSLVQLGLIHYNQNQPEPSLAYYKRVVADFPGTPEANNALLGIKNVYVDNNQVNEYFAYVESLGGDIGVSRNEQDSLTYMAAENIYMSGDCEGAIRGFRNYINDFETGAYLVNAHFYKAECQLKSGDTQDALESLNFIVESPRNVFTEPALLTASRINFDFQHYPAALEDYLMLEEIAEVRSNISEARIGKMRCYYLLNEFGNTIDAAREVLREEKLSDELAREAHFKIAKSFLEQDRFALALEEFRSVDREVSSIEGAESKYRVAEILFIRKEYQQAEDEIFEFIDQNTPHQYWMAKSFILLADIYLVRGDEFQAIQTLESIIDYYEETNDGILDQARRKKADVLKRQEAKQGEDAQEDIQIEMKETGPGNQQQRN